MEKKELTKEQIEKISAGTGASPVHVTFVVRLYFSGVTDCDLIAKRAKAAGLDITYDQVTLVAKEIDNYK